jgi:hypothetical protein
LGYMFQHGHGVAQDRAEAVRWYELPFLQCIIVTFSSGTAPPCA